MTADGRVWMQVEPKTQHYGKRIFNPLSGMQENHSSPDDEDIFHFLVSADITGQCQRLLTTGQTEPGSKKRHIQGSHQRNRQTVCVQFRIQRLGFAANKRKRPELS